MKNMFLQAATKHDTFTANGALSNSSSGNYFVDTFTTAPTYFNRPYHLVCANQELLWDSDKDMSVKFIFYLRMITRKIKIDNVTFTENVQTGQGVRDESFKRLLCLAEKHPNTFNANIWLLPIVGSWKDFWTLMQYDIELGINAINKDVIFSLISNGLSIESHCNLIKKYMPRIKSSSKLKTTRAKILNRLAIDFANFLGISIKSYNKLKASGTAHDFQKFMCLGLYNRIQWDKIPGRALSQIVNSKFIENHNLVDSYTSWLDKQDVLNYTGYVYELGKPLVENYYHRYKLPRHKEHTINKQFESLIKKAKDNGEIKGNVWCALDTSGSMSWGNGKYKPLDVCMSLGIFFSTLNEGAFHKNVIMFDNKSTIKQLSGDFCDMIHQVPMNSMGGTNFQSVVDEIIRVRKNNPQIKLEDYPKTLLVVSDMQFNCCDDVNTNYELMKSKLYDCFPKEFVDDMKFVWWNVNSKLTDFPSRIEDGGTYLFGGLDGSVISLLLGCDLKKKEKKERPNMIDVVVSALSQEILLQVKIED